MSAGFDSLALPRPWRRKRHGMALVVAVIASVALHGTLLRVFPPLAIGRPPEEELLRTFAPVQLQNMVRSVEVPLLERPVRFRPEEPGSFIDLNDEQKTFVEAVNELSPDNPMAEAPPPRGETAPLSGAPEAGERVKWEPRLDILRIEEQLYAEAVSVLPRRYVDPVPRVSEAPDITLPFEPSSTLPTEPAPVTEAMGDAGGEALREVAASVAFNPGAFTPPEAPLDEQAGMLDEPPETITDVQPVEQLLKLDVASFRPADEPEHTYFTIRISRRGAEALPVLPKDVLLIQDCSESIGQPKLNDFKAGLRRWLPKLAGHDRFNLLTFSDQVSFCFPDWVFPSDHTLAQADSFIGPLQARGRTDISASLDKLEEASTLPGRPLIAILLTDGRPTAGTVDSSDIIEQFTAQNEGRISVFSVGAGKRVNRFLLDLLTYKNRGDAVMLEDRSQVPDAMEDLARQLDRPVLTGLDYHMAGMGLREIYPQSLTHLYLDRPLVVHGRCARTAERAVIRIAGDSGVHRRDMVFELNWGETATGGADIREQWVWQRIYYLIGEHIRTQRPSIMAEIRELADRFGLAVPYGGEFALP